MAAAWPGVMVLSAHGLDLVEWTCQAIAPREIDTHFASASGWIGLGIALVAMGMMYLLGRIRRPGCYLAMGAAILSHVLLDSKWWRIWTASLYSQSEAKTNAPMLLEAVTSETWLYGIILILMLLVQTVRRSSTSRAPVQYSNRNAAIVMGLLCVAAALSRIRPLWAGAYCVALLCVLWIRRSRISVSVLWNVPVLLPLLLMVFAEILVADLDSRGEESRIKGDYSAAVATFRRAESIPSRGDSGWRKVHLGQCLSELGESEAAERAYLQGVAMSGEPNWAKYWLARFYMEQRDRHSPYYRPQQAKQLFQELVRANPDEAELIDWCRKLSRGIDARNKSP
jgi:tetratricopeptide (TPR) repeat protein